MSDPAITIGIVDRFVALYRRGWTGREIGDMYGFHFTTVNRHLRARGVPARSVRVKRCNESMAQRAAKLYRKGWSTPEIARVAGVFPSTVNAWLRKFGVPLRSPGDGLRLARGLVGKERKR